MSRPRWSEPSQWSAPGRARLWPASVAMGSWVWSWLENTAVSRITSIRKPPMAPSGFLRQNRPSTVHAPGRRRASATPGASTPSGLVAIADARVEEAVEHVHEEVREDDHDRDEHHQGLHDRVVPPQDRLHQEAREPGQVEDGLGHHEAADEERELDADHGHHRQDRVLERVAPDDDAAGLALGPRGADVVLAHHLEQRGARDAHDQGRGAV